MTNTTPAAILAPEITAHLVADERPLRVGDLSVFTDYRGRVIGCTVARTWAAGEISRDAQIECRVSGPQHCYADGERYVFEASKFRRAV